MRGFLVTLSLLLAVFTASDAFAQGACCNPLDGTCVEYFDAMTCAMLGRNYQGDGTECATANCPVPVTGACCSNTDPNGSCTEVGEDLCTAQSGTWQGAGTLCADVTCPIPAVGACWDLYYGTCSIQPQAACATNQYSYQGDGTDCTTNPPPPIGACCRASDGFCMTVASGGTTEEFCENVWPYDWLGEGTVCSNDETAPCPQPPTGACCLPDGSCLDGYFNGDTCEWDLNGVWQGLNTDCTTVSCPGPVYGACCFPNGGCLVVLEYQCEANFGVFHGDGSECWPTPCSAEPPVLGWEENFDSYANGTFLNHEGGWYGWGDNLLYAASVTDEQAHSAPHSIKVSDTVDAVHPWDRPFDDTKWIITAWQYIPSNLTGPTHFIVNSWYQHEDTNNARIGVQLLCDPATGTITENARAQAGVPNSLPLLYDQWVELIIKADFEDDGIEVYYGGQLLIDTSWSYGTVSTAAIMNIDLWSEHPEAVYYDDMSVHADMGSTGPEFGPTQPLFAGLESEDYSTRSTDLSGDPAVTWFSNGFKLKTYGAAGRPDGNVYMVSGDWGTSNSTVYLAPLGGPAIPVCDTDKAFNGLAYGKGKLYGFANYASPLGIYEIDLDTGATTLAVDTEGMRFFGFDYNPVDGLFYGITSYGSPTGLYSIDIDTGVMTFVASPVPSTNSAVGALACGNNKVYAMTIYGNQGFPMYVYDLAQGTGGTWEAMTHPYPESEQGGGMAWMQGVLAGDTNCDGKINGADISGFVMALLDLNNYETAYPDCIYYNADLNADGDLDNLDVEAFVDLVLN